MRESVGRVRRAGATGPLRLRADSGFWSKHVVNACRDHGVGYSITVRQVTAIKAAIAGIDDDTWQPIDYTASGDAEVAECPYGDGHRLVVRRTRIRGAQAELFDNWRHHAFITDGTGTAVELDAEHRAHAVVELAIRDLKEGAGHGVCTEVVQGSCQVRESHRGRLDVGVLPRLSVDWRRLAHGPRS